MTLTYRPDGNHSFFADLANQSHDSAAGARLQRHYAEMESRDVGGASSGGAQGVVPPSWLSEAYAPLVRARRSFVDLIPKMNMPPLGIDSVKTPQVTGGAAVAVQASENSGVQETDPSTGTLSNNEVVTVAGQVDVSRQLFLRALPSTDEFIFADLMAAYNEKISTQVLYGAGAGSNEFQGLDGLSSSIAQTYTQGTPDAHTCWQNITQAISKVYTQRKLGKGDSVAVVLHPRRAAWLSAAQSTASYFDQPALENLGLNIEFVADANVSTVKGASTSEDRIYVVSYPDLRLAEDSHNLVMQDVLSGTGTVRLQLYAYALFIPDRAVKGVATISGSGLISPSGW